MFEKRLEIFDGSQDARGFDFSVANLFADDILFGPSALGLLPSIVNLKLSYILIGITSPRNIN
jgi:hypothetical protein